MFPDDAWRSKRINLNQATEIRVSKEIKENWFHFNWELHSLIGNDKQRFNSHCSCVVTTLIGFINRFHEISSINLPTTKNTSFYLPCCGTVQKLIFLLIFCHKIFSLLADVNNFVRRNALFGKALISAFSVWCRY